MKTYQKLAASEADHNDRIEADSQVGQPSSADMAKQKPSMSNPLATAKTFHRNEEKGLHPMFPAYFTRGFSNIDMNANLINPKDYITLAKVLDAAPDHQALMRQLQSPLQRPGEAQSFDHPSTAVKAIETAIPAMKKVFSSNAGLFSDMKGTKKEGRTMTVTEKLAASYLPEFLAAGAGAGIAASLPDDEEEGRDGRRIKRALIAALLFGGGTNLMRRALMSRNIFGEDGNIHLDLSDMKIPSAFGDSQQPELGALLPEKYREPGGSSLLPDGFGSLVTSPGTFNPLRSGKVTPPTYSGPRFRGIDTRPVMDLLNKEPFQLLKDRVGLQ
jgi:hypothetical protein